MAASCESCARRDICPLASEGEACEHYLEEGDKEKPSPYNAVGDGADGGQFGVDKGGNDL